MTSTEVTFLMAKDAIFVRPGVCGPYGLSVREGAKKLESNICTKENRDFFTSAHQTAHLS